MTKKSDKIPKILVKCPECENIFLTSKARCQCGKCTKRFVSSDNLVTTISTGQKDQIISGIQVHAEKLMMRIEKIQIDQSEAQKEIQRIKEETASTLKFINNIKVEDKK